MNSPNARQARQIVKLAVAVSMAAFASDSVLAQAPASGAATKKPAAATAKPRPARDAKQNPPWRVVSTYVPPRTPDGQPDIQGMYEPGYFNQPAETAVGGPWKPASPKGGAQIGPTDFGARQAAETDPAAPHVTPTNKPMVVDPPDGIVPMQPWVAAMRKEIYAKQEKPEFLDPRVRCLQAGVPRANTPVYYNSYQIIQKPGYVVILYEWNHMTRIIPLDGRPHLDPKIRLPMGDSRGRWEGNTLVVDVTNFNDDSWVLGHGGIGEGQPAETATSGHGIVHSPELHVVERFTPIDKNIIRYEATIEDPKAFTRPFTVAFEAMVRGREDHQLFEYACHEGNRDGILMATGVDIDPSQK